MKMTNDVAKVLVDIHNVLIGVETKGTASMAVVDSIRALEHLLQSSTMIEEKRDEENMGCSEDDA